MNHLYVWHGSCGSPTWSRCWRTEVFTEVYVSVRELRRRRAANQAGDTGFAEWCSGRVTGKSLAEYAEMLTGGNGSDTISNLLNQCLPRVGGDTEAPVAILVQAISGSGGRSRRFSAGLPRLHALMHGIRDDFRDAAALGMLRPPLLQ